MSPLHHEDYKKKVLMGIWRVIGSNRFHNLTARSNLVFNSPDKEGLGLIKWDTDSVSLTYLL
eukprot:1159875-Pelagomonas_calceolata.AAC.3